MRRKTSLGGRNTCDAPHGDPEHPPPKACIYRLATLETVLRLEDLGISTATGAVEPGFPARPFLEAMGFVAVGAPVLFDDPPRRQTLAQCIRLDLSRHGPLAWRELRQSHSRSSGAQATGWTPICVRGHTVPTFSILRRRHDFSDHYRTREHP